MSPRRMANVADHDAPEGERNSVLHFNSKTAAAVTPWLILAGPVLGGLILLSGWNYVVFHSLVELFSVGVAMALFLIAWNVRQRLDNDFLLFVAMAYAAAGLLDLLHTLAYPGMGAIAGVTMDPPTQIWIAARYLQSLCLLVAPLWLTRRLPAKTVLVGLAAIDVLVLLSIFHPWAWLPAFPACHLGAAGLTPFKVVSEYIISAILLAAVGLLWLRRARLDRTTFAYMAAALLFTTASEIAFTSYVSVQTPSNMIGHLLKVVAMYLTYKALIEAGLKRPFDVLFRNLFDSRERLNLALASSGMATFEWDIVNNRRVWDDNLHRLLGTNPNNFAGTAEEFFRVMPPEDRSTVQAALARAVETGPGYETEYRAIWPDGSVHHIAARGRVHRDSEGRAIRMTGICWDMTQRKQVEEALAAAKLTAEQARTAAESASKAKDHFLAALSHELRTPLMPVLMAVGLMETDPTISPERREDLAMIRRNLELEVRLIDDLLDLNRVVHGKIELHIKRLDVHRKLDNVLEICRAEIQAKQLQMTLNFAAESRCVDGDGGRLQQVFWNLLRNAIKFTPEGGTITVRTGNPQPDTIRIEVVDSGVGIEPETIPRLFAAFEQGSREVTKVFGGLGLGLAISRNMIELHGGSIRAHSLGKGRGATFIVELPIAHAPIPTPVPSAAPAHGKADKPPALRILLVEDHTDTRRLMARLLKDSGHTVTTAGNVSDALVAAERSAGQFDLVLSDLGLPDGSGHDLMRQLRDRWNLRGIALSGFGMEQDIAQSRAAGFVDHLTKPVHLAVLQAALGRATGSGAPDAVDAGD